MRLFATLSLLSVLSFGQSKITAVEGITEYRLANGLQVLLFPDNSKPKVTVNICYLVGSRHEGSGETGMAHLLEHLVFKGTTQRGDIKVELSNHGADFNGNTLWDRTTYYETLLGTDDNLRYALEMEADRMVNSRIAKSDLDTEFSVVRNEFEQRENSPGNVLFERVLRGAYLWHAYGRTVIGSRSDIEHVPIENLQAFYRKYYQPDNAVLVIAGKFDAAKALNLIQETFGKIPKPARKLTPTWTEEPTQDGEREVMLRRTGDYQSLTIAYHIPAGSHPDYAAIQVLVGILSDTPSGRLYKALVESKKAASAGADDLQLHDPGLFLVMARLRKEDSFPEAEKTTLAVLDGVAKEPPSKEEVERAKTKILKNIDLSLNNSEAVGIDLSEWAAMGDWRLLFLDRDRIKNVTPEDVARVAKAYLKPSNRTLGRFVPEAKPERSEIPATPDVAASLKDYKGQAAIEEGEAFDPSPANVEARTIRVTLPNGMKLAMLPKKTRGGTVTAVVRVHFGDEKSVFGKQTAAALAAAMLMRGTAKHTRQQLADEIDKAKARIGANGGDTFAQASISTVRDNFLTSLKLAAEVLREPSFPEAEFETLRNQSIAGAEGSRTDPAQIAFSTINRHLAPFPPGDPRATPTVDERIANLKAVKLDDVKAFYRDFYGASNSEMAVVGDFDPAAVQKLARELFGDWKSPKPYSEILRGYRKLDAINQSFETPDKTNAFFVAAVTVPMDQAHPDYPAMLLANSMLGGGLKSRLWLRIREKEGLSYTVQSDFGAGVKDHVGQFLALVACNPQNIVKVEASFRDEMKKAAAEGFAEDEVKVAKEALLKELELGRSQDGTLLSQLARNELYGWTMQRQAEIEKKIAELKAADVSAAFKRTIDPASLSVVKAGDFKKAGVTP